MPDPVPPPSTRRAAKWWAWASVVAGVVLLCAGLAASGLLLLLSIVAGYNWISVLLALPPVNLAVLGAVVLSDGCVLLRRGQRNPRLFFWTVILSASLLATGLAVAVALSPVRY